MFVDVRGHRVHTVTLGAGERTVVALAGAFGTWEVWLPPFELLSRRHRVVAYDHPGVGSTRVGNGGVGFDEQVAVCEELLDLVGGRVTLVGDSSMAAVAVEVAARRPDRVEALALVAAGVTHRESGATRDFVAGLREAFEPTVEAFVAFCVPEEGAHDERDWLAQIIRRTGGERAAAMVEAFYGVDVAPRLADLRMPCLVLHGARDALPSTRVDGAREISSCIPDCELVVLEDAGHVPTLTRPREVADAIERLLARV